MKTIQSTSTAAAAFDVPRLNASRRRTIDTRSARCPGLRPSHFRRLGLHRALAGATVVSGLLFPTAFAREARPSVVVVQPPSGGDQSGTGPIPIGPETTPGDADYLYKISLPGSYYLTGNVIREVGKHGIGIFGGSVTLDLNGFSVIGEKVDSPNNDGIRVENTYAPVRIHNGNVLSWGHNGIRVHTGATVELDSVKASSNGHSGILMMNTAGVISRCIADENGGAGIYCGGSSDSRGYTVTDSLARENNHNGFVVYGGTARGCTAYGNGNSGFHAIRSMLVDCISDENLGDGILAGESQVRGCKIRGNGGYGIRVWTDCLISGNLVHDHQSEYGAGIRVFSDKNRIEGNDLVDNTIGLKVSHSDNLVASNVARGNGTNYQIVAGAHVGPIVAPPATEAIDGDSGDVGSWTSNPWANFAY